MRDDPARRAAQELRRRGLEPVARLLLESHRPLAPLVSDAAAALGPLMAAVGGRTAGGLVALAEDGTAMDRLVAELDELEELNAEPE